ncbi:MAG: TolC family protein [Saprospiraceae bacterium]|nr:TolC family protein [Saprospiraceae bacterium]
MKFVNIHKHLWVLFTLLGFANSLPSQEWSLGQVLQRASVHNKSLLIAANRSEMATEREKEVRSQRLPQLRITAEYRYYAELPYQLLPLSVFNGPEGQFKEAQFGVPHNASAGLSLTVPLFTPSRRAMSDAATAGREVAGLRELSAADQLFFDLSLLYFNAQILRNQLVFADSNLANSRRLLQVVLILKEQKLARQTDVDQVRLQMEQIATQRHLAEGTYRQVINTIKWMAGIEGETSLDVVLRPVMEDAVARSEEPALDWKIADARLRLARAEGAVLKNSRLPVVAAIAQLSGVGLGYTGEPESFWKSYVHAFGGIQLQMPLYQGGRTHYQMRQKNLEIENVLQEREMLSDKLAMQRENALIQMDTRRKAASHTQALMSQGLAVYEQMLVLQSQGLASLSEVLRADNSLREMQQSYLSATVSYLEAVLGWKRINGSLSPDAVQSDLK